MKLKLKITLMAILVMPFAGFTQNYVTLYADCYYKGPASKLTPGRYSLSNQTVGNRNLSSIRVPRGMRVVIYDSYEPGSGSKTSFVADVMCLSRDWNDRAMSVVVDNYNNNSNDNGYYPGNNSGEGITVYNDLRMTGTSKTYTTGYYNFRNTAFDASITSLRIPEGWTVILYDNYNYRGNSYTVTADFNNLKDARGDWNDRARSMRVSSRYSNNNSGNSYNVYGVTIYTDARMQGQQRYYTPGAYNLNGTGFEGNVTSLRVPSGYVILLYDQYNFRGNSYTVTSDFNNLSDAAGNWNDRARSIIVRKSK